MDNNEAQKKEDLLLDLYKIHAYIPNDEQGNPLTPFGNFCAGYEAAQQQSAGDIAELKCKVNQFVGLVGDLETANLELKADNERLREALEELARLGNEPHYGNSIGNDIAIRALSATSTQSLQAHDEVKGK